MLQWVPMDTRHFETEILAHLAEGSVRRPSVVCPFTIDKNRFFFLISQWISISILLIVCTKNQPTPTTEVSELCFEK